MLVLRLFTPQLLTSMRPAVVAPLQPLPRVLHPSQLVFGVQGGRLHL